MSLIRIDGFDSYPASNGQGAGPIYGSAISTAEYTITGGVFSNSTRTGIGYALSIGYGSQLTYSFNPGADLVTGFAYQPGDLNFHPITQFLYDNYLGTVSVQASLFVSPTGALSIETPVGLIGVTPVNTVFSNTWHYIEMRIKFDGAAGYCEVRVDGNTVFTFSGSTVPLNWSAAANMQGLGTNQSSNTAGGVYDDWYLLRNDGNNNTDFLGDCVVHAMTPISDAGPNQMSQFGGGVSHASAVGEIPTDNDASYLYSNTSGAQEFFTISEFSADMVDALAVQVDVRARKDTAGVAKYNIALRSGSTVALSPALTPPTSYLTQSAIFEQDPAGGPWTKVSAQAAQIGFQVV